MWKQEILMSVPIQNRNLNISIIYNSSFLIRYKTRRLLIKDIVECSSRWPSQTQSFPQRCVLCVRYPSFWDTFRGKGSEREGFDEDKVSSLINSCNAVNADSVSLSISRETFSSLLRGRWSLLTNHLADYNKYLYSAVDGCNFKHCTCRTPLPY